MENAVAIPGLISRADRAAVRRSCRGCPRRGVPWRCAPRRLRLRARPSRSG